MGGVNIASVIILKFVIYCFALGVLKFVIYWFALGVWRTRESSCDHR